MAKNLLDEIKSYLESPVHDSEQAILLMKKIQEEGGEVLELASQIFEDLLTSKEKESIIEDTAKCGYLALTKQDQQKLVGLVGSEEEAKKLSYYEVMQRLNGKNIVEFAEELEDIADRTEDINYVYSLEKDLIESDDLKKALAEGSDEDVETFLLRYFEGAGYAGSEIEKQMIVMGLGNRDIVVSNHVRDDEKIVESAIKKFEKTNPDVKFATLDLSAQNRILTEFYMNLTRETRENADFIYVDSLIKGNLNHRERQSIADKVLSVAIGSESPINEEIFKSEELKNLLGISSVDFKKIDLNRKVILCIDDKIFKNLISQILKNRFDETMPIVEDAKKRVIEENIKNRKNNNYDYPTDIPNVGKMSVDQKRDFNYRVSLLNRHLREIPDSDVLKNILINTHLINEKSMIENMVSKQDNLAKKYDKLTLEEIKQFLDPKVVNLYFSENQELKTLMLQIGANNLFLTFSDAQLKPKIIRTLNKNEKLRISAISYAFAYGKNDEALNKALKQALDLDKNFSIRDRDRQKLITMAGIKTYLKGSKILKDKENEVFEAVKNLMLEDDEFSNELYNIITEIVSYESTASDAQQERFFGDAKIIIKAKHIAEAFEKKQSVVFDISLIIKRTARASSNFVGELSKHIPANAEKKLKANKERRRLIAIMTDKVKELSTKQSGREYAEDAKEILGEYYKKIYNSKNVVTRLIGGGVSSESPAIQQRDILKGLGILMLQTNKKIDSFANYVSASHEAMSDPRFIEKLTLKGSCKLLGGNINYSKFEELILGGKKEDQVVSYKKQLELMEKEPTYKMYVEEFNKRNERYKEAVEELEKLTDRLEKLNSSLAKSSETKNLIKSLKLSIDDANKKIAVLGPYMKEAKELKENFEKNYAEKQYKQTKRGTENLGTILDIFDYYDVILKAGKIQLNPSDNPKLAGQIRKATSNYISSMLSNIERINGLMLKLGAKQITLKNTMLGTIVKQSNLIIKSLKTEGEKLKAKLEEISDKNSAKYKKFKMLFDSVNNHILRINNDIKSLEVSLDKLGIAELKNKK